MITCPNCGTSNLKGSTLICQACGAESELPSGLAYTVKH